MLPANFGIKVACIKYLMIILLTVHAVASMIFKTCKLVADFVKAGYNMAVNYVHCWTIHLMLQDLTSVDENLLVLVYQGGNRYRWKRARWTGF